MIENKISTSIYSHPATTFIWESYLDYASMVPQNDLEHVLHKLIQKKRALELDNNLQKSLSPRILHEKMWIKTSCKGTDMIYNLYLSGLVSIDT
jgi:hypothetical protein